MGFKVMCVGWLSKIATLAAGGLGHTVLNGSLGAARLAAGIELRERVFRVRTNSSQRLNCIFHHNEIAYTHKYAFFFSFSTIKLPTSHLSDS